MGCLLDCLKKPQQDIEQKLPFKIKEMLYNRIAEAESRGIMLPDYLIGLSTVEHADYAVCREQIIGTLIGLKARYHRIIHSSC